jgi:hypothetical protein
VGMSSERLVAEEDEDEDDGEGALVDWEGEE